MHGWMIHSQVNKLYLANQSLRNRTIVNCLRYRDFTHNIIQKCPIRGRACGDYVIYLGVGRIATPEDTTQSCQADVNAISSMTREIKNDITEIKADTTLINQDTAQILAEITRLQAQLPRDEARAGSSGIMLQRYLAE